jgi:hypothetical protein
MNWEEAKALIRNSIRAGEKLDNRIVLEGPEYKCKGNDYDGSPGYKIKIGKTTCIEVPLKMLQAIYSDALANNGIYDNSVFKKRFERQLKNHGCHVHVVGKIFEVAGIATKLDNRTYRVH